MAWKAVIPAKARMTSKGKADTQVRPYEITNPCSSHLTRMTNKAVIPAINTDREGAVEKVPSLILPLP